jgi:hypothetical protein
VVLGLIVGMGCMQKVVLLAMMIPLARALPIVLLRTVCMVWSEGVVGCTVEVMTLVLVGRTVGVMTLVLVGCTVGVMTLVLVGCTVGVMTLALVGCTALMLRVTVAEVVWGYSTPLKASSQ